MKNLVEIRNLHFTRGDRQIFSGIDIDIPKADNTFGLLTLGSGEGRDLTSELVEDERSIDEGQAIINGREDILRKRRDNGGGGRGRKTTVVRPHTANARVGRESPPLDLANYLLEDNSKPLNRRRANTDKGENLLIPSDKEILKKKIRKEKNLKSQHDNQREILRRKVLNASASRKVIYR